MRRTSTALALIAALALAACGDDVPQTASVAGQGTAVLGNGTGSDPALTDARGRAIPPPPVSAGVQAQAVRAGEDTALALWLHEGAVLTSVWTREGGWSAIQPLEDIYGTASDAQLASNGRGVAMAMWRHTVGSIQSLRFSRFEQGAGWSQPDVVPGALPRPDVEGLADDGPRLEMDARGNVVAQWPSGFDAGQMQTARYVDGQGWTEAASVPLATAADATAPAR